MSTSQTFRVGLTTGDPAGVGPEVIRAALASGGLPAVADYQVIGSASADIAGRPSAETARMAAAALEEAATLARRGEIDAVVTGPVNKAALGAIGWKFPGQTEFFAERCGITNFGMLLTGGSLTVALVTIHIPLGDVARSLRKEEIVRVGRLLLDFLDARSPEKEPIAVAGLNPHAGEAGRIGREEIEIIEPAVAELNASAEGNRFQGPISPDTVFHRASKGEFAAVLCMYHDQGLIPLKLQGFHDGVNVTLGLPFPRTSPDHGTAFDIAGKGEARPDSMIAAIRLAVDLLKARARKGAGTA
jgi:4-hydroxythreonine-4-phosphate dehydrogenase